MDVIQAIKYANSILPGIPASDNESDSRWQAIIEIGEFNKSNPEEVWTFVSRWGIYEDEDLQSAVATCLLEHLLEHHFDLIFPRVEILSKKSVTFARTFSMCFKFDKLWNKQNSTRFDQLKEWVRSDQGI